MPSLWYARIMGENIGPFSAQTLLLMASKKQVTDEDFIRSSDSDEWIQFIQAKHTLQQLAVKDQQSSKNRVSDSKPQSVPKSTQVARPNPRLMNCPDCGGSVSKSATNCPHCGLALSRNRVVAGLLAWCFGLAGLHKFYIGEKRQGILYLVATMMIIPMPFVAIISIVDGFRYFAMSDEEFAFCSRPATFRQ